jgi:hypothetical protein
MDAVLVRDNGAAAHARVTPSVDGAASTRGGDGDALWVIAVAALIGAGGHQGRPYTRRRW